MKRASSADLGPQGYWDIASSDVLLTPARTDDAEGIFIIEAEAFAQPWGRQAIIDELKNPDAWHQVARKPALGGNRLPIVGYILVRFLTDEMHIMKLAVGPR